jgi:LuxR family transcriptional regulator, maltose regulon positive regulatory protein
VISVVAPAGYGKPILLAQWAESPQPRVAWVSADHRDNDLHQRPDLGDLPRQAAELRTSLASDPGAMRGASSLTTAELRLLPLLPTHLTLNEIGERLHVTRNTVKTQAIAIYRKFGVSSRRAAISRMYELGLLPGE